jgi:hypothetical protein
MLSKEAVGVRGVAMLPVVPYFIDHLSFVEANATVTLSAPQSLSFDGLSTYGMMHPEKWFCKRCTKCQRKFVLLI